MEPTMTIPSVHSDLRYEIAEAGNALHFIICDTEDDEVLDSLSIERADAGEIGLALALRYAEPATNSLKTLETGDVAANTDRLHVVLDRHRDATRPYDEIRLTSRLSGHTLIGLPLDEARASALAILRVLAATKVQP